MKLQCQKNIDITWVRLDFGNTYSAKSTELTGEKNARKFKEFSASNLKNCMEMKNAYNISIFYCLTDRGCYNISLKLPFIAYGKDGRQSLHFMIRKRKIRLFIEFLVAFSTLLWLSHQQEITPTHLKNTEQLMYACKAWHPNLSSYISNTLFQNGGN